MIEITLYNGSRTKDAWNPDSPEFIDDCKPETRTIVAKGFQLTHGNHIKIYGVQEESGEDLFDIFIDSEGFIVYDGIFFGDITISAKE